MATNDLAKKVPEDDQTQVDLYRARSALARTQQSAAQLSEALETLELAEQPLNQLIQRNARVEFANAEKEDLAIRKSSLMEQIELSSPK